MVVCSFTPSRIGTMTSVFSNAAAGSAGVAGVCANVMPHGAAAVTITSAAYAARRVIWVIEGARLFGRLIWYTMQPTRYVAGGGSGRASRLAVSWLHGDVGVQLHRGAWRGDSAPSAGRFHAASPRVPGSGVRRWRRPAVSAR